jgi:DNA repair protein RadC
MDDIERVDCFERLHQHLLRHDPGLQKRIEALRPFAYRDQDLVFFLTHLVALLSGLDEQSAEGKRRIRRLVMELDEERPAESAHQQLILREQAQAGQKAFSETQRRNLRASFQNLKTLSDDPARTGRAFDAEMDRLEHLPARIDWIRRLLPCLTRLNAFRYLGRIGFPVIVPTGPCQTVLFRLGLLERTGGSLETQIRTCDVGESIASSLGRSVGEIDLWIRAFIGALSDLAPATALCSRVPHCEPCDLQSYCHYFRFRRPRAQDASAPLPLKQWRPTERPRERLVQHGASQMEDTELLAIVLRTGAGKINVLEMARRLLERFGSLRGIEDASLEELKSVHGIGTMKAIELKAVFELGRRLAFAPVEPGLTVMSSADLFASYRSRFDDVKQEEFHILMLDSKNRVIREEMVSRGGLDASVVHPREVFKPAIRASAASVIFIHNHPSGDPSPSPEDHLITEQLEEAGSLLHIRVLDHLVIGRDSYYSFADGQVSTPHDSESE